MSVVRNKKIRPRSIIIVDPSVVGQSHLLVNVGFINLLSKIYEEITVVAESEHCAALQKYADFETGFALSFVPYKKRRSLLPLLIPLIMRNRSANVIFLNLEYALYAFASIILPFLSAGRIYWVLHSHLVTFGSEYKGAAAKNFLKYLILFKIFRSGRFVVCAEIIKQNLISYLGRDAPSNRIFSVFHPVCEVKSCSQSRHDPGIDDLTLIRFFHGWHDINHDTEVFLSKVQQLSVDGNAFRFEQISSKIARNDRGTYFKLDYKERINMIKECKFFLHLPPDKYRFQASGSLMDCVVSGTPIISINTDFSTELEQIIGRFGFFFDDHNALYDFLRAGFGPAYKEDYVLFKTNLALSNVKIVERGFLQLEAAGL